MGERSLAGPAGSLIKISWTLALFFVNLNNSNKEKKL